MKNYYLGSICLLSAFTIIITPTKTMSMARGYVEGPAPEFAKNFTPSQEDTLAGKNTGPSTGAIASRVQTDAQVAALTTKNVNDHAAHNQFKPSSTSAFSQPASQANSPAYFKPTINLTHVDQLDASFDIDSMHSTPPATPSLPSSQASSPAAQQGFLFTPYSPSALDAQSDIATPSVSPQSSATSSPKSVHAGIEPYTFENSNPHFNDAQYNDWNVIDLPDADQQPTTPLVVSTHQLKQKSTMPAGLKFAINASDTAARAGKALQTIGQQIYDTPGAIAQKLGHSDGNIITGKEYSLASAANNVYQALPSLPNFSTKTSPVPARKPYTAKDFNSDSFDEFFDKEMSEPNEFAQGTQDAIKNRANLQKQATQEAPATWSATLAKIFTMDWFTSHNITAENISASLQSYVTQIVDFATKNLNPIDGARYVNEQLSRLFGNTTNTYTPVDVQVPLS